MFLEPPTRRCRVWQSDFSEFETTGGGTWRLSGVVDYVAKVALACPVTTQTAAGAIASLEAARAQAEAWLGQSLLSECLDAHTGELAPIAVVTDNGSRLQVGGLLSLHCRPARVHPRPHPPPLTTDQWRRGSASC